jgi:hypothetical protein
MTEPSKIDHARNRELARIHIMKAELKLEDDDYRAQVHAMTGFDSAGACDWTGRKKLIAHLESLKRAYGMAPRGARGARGGGGAPARARSPRTAKLDPLGRKVVAMWMALHDAGVVRKSTERTLDAYVKRMTGVESIAWCSADQKRRLVESLKAWAAREQVLGADGMIFVGGAHGS